MTRSDLVARIEGCRLCEERFAATATAHRPRPVVWFVKGARLLIAGQAPGTRVHASGRPFTDRSGDVLRSWLGLEPAAFYDRTRVAILPMAFCFPGQDRAGSDLPPPPLCAATWRAAALAEIGPVGLIVLAGGAAIRWHLGPGSVSEWVGRWRETAPAVFPLPHPSWRTTGWQKANPWFGDEVLPALRTRVRQVLDDGT